MNTMTRKPLTAKCIMTIYNDILLPEGVTIAEHPTTHKIYLYKEGLETWQDVLGFTIQGLGMKAFYCPKNRSIYLTETGKIHFRSTDKRVSAKYNVFSALWNLRARLTGQTLDSFFSKMSKLESPENIKTFIATIDTWQSPYYVQ